MEFSDSDIGMPILIYSFKLAVSYVLFVEDTNQVFTIFVFTIQCRTTCN